jgi:predicted nucleic acid-binding protein
MPPPSSIVVVNTSPLISLDTCNQLNLLRQLYARVLVPKEVERELSVGGTTALPKGLTREHRKWIKVQALRASPLPTLVAALDRGEAEVIALALEIRCPLVLLDDTLARTAAQSIGLHAIGTIGVLLRAKTLGLLSAIEPSIDLMISKGIWLNKSLIDSVLRQAGERF